MLGWRSVSATKSTAAMTTVATAMIGPRRPRMGSADFRQRTQQVLELLGIDGEDRRLGPEIRHSPSVPRYTTANWRDHADCEDPRARRARGERTGDRAARA